MKQWCAILKQFLLLSSKGRLHATHNDLKGAIKAWEADLALNPFDVGTLENLRKAYEMIGDEKRSTEIADRLNRIRTIPRNQW